MNYDYKGGETPEERLRNKLSVVFTVVEHTSNGKCDKKLIDEAVKVIPDIVEHLDDIEEFYKNKYEKHD